MRTHIQLAHMEWGRLVRPGDVVVDATCGNGHDTLMLAQLALLSDRGHVYAQDIQKEALASTRSLLEKEVPHLLPRVTFVEGCHSRFHCDAVDVALVVYNLGYLPGGDKNITTKTHSTLASLYQAQEILRPNGLISITLYPGHPEGAVETESIMLYMRSLDPNKWRYELLEPNANPTSPKLLFLRPQM